MNILVTGGAGFIGSHIVDEYIKRGHKVIVIDNLSSGKIENVNKNAKFIKCDIRDSNRVKEIIFSEKPQCINHHAAQISVSYSVKEPVFDACVNIIGTLNLLRYASSVGVKKFIFASSGGTIYGDVKDIAFENDKVNPASPYGISKLACENYIMYYNRAYPIQCTILRYSNVYGPRQDPFGEAGVVAIFTNKILSGEVPIINGDGCYIRDYVYCGDVVSANMIVTESDLSGVFNIGTGEGTDVNELFLKIKGVLNSDINARYGPHRDGDIRKSILSSELFRKTTNWHPRYSLKEGLQKTIDYFKNNLLD